MAVQVDANSRALGVQRLTSESVTSLCSFGRKLPYCWDFQAVAALFEVNPICHFATMQSK